MAMLLRKSTQAGTAISRAWIRSLSTADEAVQSYRFVVAGGGAGGLAVASTLARKYGENSVAVIEPSSTHYYQPMWTLVGAGEVPFEESGRPMEKVMPKNVSWIKSKVKAFEPGDNLVITTDSHKVHYDYLIVAMGLKVNFDKIIGLPQALEDPMSGVASNFSPKYVTKTADLIREFKGGNAIFTMPTLPIKCPGAPQKIMYLAEDHFRKAGIRDKCTVMYNSALAVIFGVKKYANSLWKVVDSRGIKVNLHTNLMEVIPDKRKALFSVTDPESGATSVKEYEYDMMHVTPPMQPLNSLRHSPLADGGGWVDVNKETLQHKSFPNVFALGDCTNVPTSKTAAAVAAQSGVLKDSLQRVMAGQKPVEQYDGYTSCPLITGVGKTILAEFDFNAAPLETFPVDQGKERWSMYHLKKTVMPEIYWSGLLKGIWRGPSTYRKIFHLGLK